MAERMEALDLVIEVLREHERHLDELLNRYEKMFKLYNMVLEDLEELIDDLDETVTKLTKIVRRRIRRRERDD